MFKTTGFLLLGLFAIACGLPTQKDVNYWRVVGGSNASPGEFPYQVSLRSSTGSHFCGGSLINARTVVTAAHCLPGRAPSNTRVVVGTIYLTSGGVAYGVSRITGHSGFNSNTLANDVGVVITSSNIALGSTVSTVALSTSTVGGGVTAMLTGWGTTSYPGNAPNNLQKLALNTITVASCKNALANIGPIYDTQICTFTRAGQGACHGDSGGPLVSSGRLIGIVSWGYPCARGVPDVFARVSSYYNWIVNNMA